MKLLADTSALLALFLSDDRNHEAAAHFVRRSPATGFLTTELIVTELATRLRARIGAERAVGVVREVMRSGRYELLFVDEKLLSGAVDRMAQFADKRLSLTDCASFELIDRLGLDGALTFDTDFRDCGFRMLP